MTIIVDTLKACNPQVIRGQLCYYLYAFKIYDNVRHSHETRAKRRREKAPQPDVPSAPLVELAEFPRLWRALRWFQVYTNAIMVYILLKYVQPDLLANLARDLFGIEHLFGLPVHCFIVGRFVAYPGLDRTVPILHAIAHLSYRCGLKCLARPYRLDMIDFLCQKESDLRNYYHYHSLYARWHREQLSDQKLEHPRHATRGASATSRAALESSITSQWVHRYHMYHPFMCSKASRDSISSIGGSHGFGAASQPRGPPLVLRPNRTLDAKRWLERRMTCMGLVLAITLGSVAIVSLGIILLEIAYDSRHLEKYPNCDTELEKFVPERHGATPGTAITSKTATAPHLLLGLCDFIESGPVWFESGIGLTFVFVLPFVIIQDLRLYGRHLSSKLASILHEARGAQVRAAGAGFVTPRQVLLMAAKDQARARGDSILLPGLLRYHRRPGMSACTTPRTIAYYDARTGNVHGAHLDRALDELVHEICDFFRQFRHAELVVSDIISAMFIFWFLGVFGFGYTLVKLYHDGHSILGLPLPETTCSFLSFFCVPLGLFAACVFQLQGECSESQRTLHSLMVYLRPEFKLKYLKVLEYFSEQKQHQFRFIMGHRFTPAIMVTIVSWSSSWLALFFSIIHMRE